MGKKGERDPSKIRVGLADLGKAERGSSVMRLHCVKIKCHNQESTIQCVVFSEEERKILHANPSIDTRVYHKGIREFQEDRRESKQRRNQQGPAHLALGQINH